MVIQLMMMYTYHINLEWSIHPKCFEALPIFRTDCLIKHIKGEKEYSLTCNFKNDSEIPALKKQHGPILDVALGGLNFTAHYQSSYGEYPCS